MVYTTLFSLISWVTDEAKAKMYSNPFPPCLFLKTHIPFITVKNNNTMMVKSSAFYAKSK